MAVQDYKINYKSDFVLTINGDAGWAIPFCIKFWTGMPSQAYFVGFDGVKYVNCRVGDTPTQLLVMFDDHHLPIGPLRMQIAYHTTIEEFPGSVFDEVTNARDVIVTIDGTDYQVMLDFTGEDAPELEFDLPAYANEAERIQNELQRQQNEADRIAAELQREQATAAAVQGAENVNAQLNGTTLTVTNRNGVSTSVNTKGEQGEQGPVGPEGPQGEQGVSIVSFRQVYASETATYYSITFSDGHEQSVAIPKGAKGDTGATGPTGPQGPQGETGVSITGFVETGETETATLYNITFSDGTTQQVAIPKGEKGDQGPVGPQGPQGPMGDVAVITPEQQAAFTMYSVPGQNTNGPMTQKAVTDAIGNIAASGVSYNNSQSGLAADNVQGALDEIVNGIGVSPNYTPNQTLNIDDRVLYPGTVAVCTTDVWITTGDAISIFIPVGNAKTIRITANSNANAAVGFVTKKYETGDVSPSWVSGWSSALRITANTYSDLSVPEDAEYLYVGLKSASGTVLKPAGIVINETVSINERLNALADKDEELVGDINDELYEQSPAVIYTPSQVLNLSDYTLKNGIVGGDNKWSITGKHIMIPVGNATQFLITANASYATGYAWLKKDKVYEHNTTPDYADNETGRRTVTAGTSDTTLPSPPPTDAVYLLINAANAGGYNLLPTNVTVVSIDPNYVPPRNVSRIDLLEEGLEENTNKTNAILGNYEATDGDMNLNILKAGREDGAICYWWYPHIISTLMPHKRIYYTSVDTYGGTIVACVNGFDKRAWKTVLKRMLNNGEIDLHSTACIQMLSDGRLICAYTEGHSQTNYMHIRVTKRPEDITEWDYTVSINWGGIATYAQYHYINGRHYIFSRVGYGNYNTNSWAFIYSDDLATWSEPHTFIVQSSNYQYYIWLKPIADRPNMLRFISYSNPAYNDTNIRCGVIDFEHNKVYKHDGVTELTGSINSTAGLEGTYSSSQFDVLVAKPSSGKQRMFDLAVTNLDTIRIAYGRQSSIYVGNYHVYEWVDGVATDFNVVEAGDVLFNHNNTLSQCGICFVDKDTLFVSRSSADATGYDYMEIWKRGENGWAFDKEVYKELKGTGHYRNAYPIADPEGRYVMWMRGFLSQDTYAGSVTDVILYDVVSDVVF